MRLFVALDLPEDLRDGLMAVQDGLGLGREVPEDNLHLTLAFLDDQPMQVAEQVHDMLSALRAPQVALRVRGAELFGGGQPSLIAAMVERSTALVGVQAKVAQAVRLAGVDLPRRRFRPHVTLVRFPRHLPDVAPVRIGRWLAAHGDLALDGGMAGQVTLYRSHLHAEGPIYEALASYPLRP